MANSTPLPPVQSIPNEPVTVTDHDLSTIGGRYLAAASLWSGDVIGVYLDRNGHLILSRVNGNDEMPLCMDPPDLEILASLMIEARDRIRRMARDGA